MDFYNKRIIRPNPTNVENVESGYVQASANSYSELNNVNSVSFARSANLPTTTYQKTANGLVWQFTTPSYASEYTITISSGKGYDSPYSSFCANACSGYASQKLSVVGIIPASTNVVFYPGHGGFATGSSTENDLTCGGDGGVSFVMYENPTGSITWNGTKYTPIVAPRSGPGGNDPCYAGCVGYGGRSIVSTESTFVTFFGTGPANGVLYSRGGATAIGGYPWGVGKDDSTNGSGPANHYVNSAFTGTIIGNGSTMGSIRFDGAFSLGTTLIP